MGGIRVVWDVAHNIAKIEEHIVDGEELLLCVHRKGATRALPGGHRLLPGGISGNGPAGPGPWGHGERLLCPGWQSRRRLWLDSCHGAGRRLSRGEAKRLLQRDEVFAEPAEAGVELRAASRQVVLAVAPTAYKDVDEVVRISEGAGLTWQVLRLAHRGALSKDEGMGMRMKEELARKIGELAEALRQTDEAKRLAATREEVEKREAAKLMLEDIQRKQAALQKPPRRART